MGAAARGQEAAITQQEQELGKAVAWALEMAAALALQMAAA